MPIRRKTRPQLVSVQCPRPIHPSSPAAFYHRPPLFLLTPLPLPDNPEQSPLESKALWAASTSPWSAKETNEEQPLTILRQLMLELAKLPTRDWSALSMPQPSTAVLQPLRVKCVAELQRHECIAFCGIREAPVMVN